MLIEDKVFINKVKSAGKDINEYIEEKRKKFSTAVYDHIDLNKEGIKNLKSIYNKYTKMYYTSTKKLFEIYNSIQEFRNPDDMIYDICDEKVFKPSKLERFEEKQIYNRTLIIGWVGNSVHSGQGDVDLKGFNTIIKPVVDELKIEGYNIEGHYADRKVKWRLEDEMVKYYSEIDVCICASIHEGTPRPVLEAMCCGVPIISTDVGIVSEAFGTKQREFIIGDREDGKNDIDVRKLLKEKITELYNNRKMFKELSEENLTSIIEFDGGKTIKKFEEFFNKCLEQ